MPRKAREKNSTAIYHIISRSISEVQLYREDSDKDFYLQLLKRYLRKYQCSLYAYCLMSNHVHLHLDPKGFDISTFMHGINTAYVQYFNKKYSRHGHVFQGRFQSRILATESYNLAVSAYIHNNPYKIPEYFGKEETYKYSSYGIYLGIAQDEYKIIDKNFVQGLFHVRDPKAFSDKYYEFVSRNHDLSNLEELHRSIAPTEENEYTSGRQVVIREMDAIKVISFISDKLLTKNRDDAIAIAQQKLVQYRAFTAFVLRVLCGLRYREICNHLYNITISGCARLCDKGYDLLNSQKSYHELFLQLVNGTA